MRAHAAYQANRHRIMHARIDENMFADDYRGENSWQGHAGQPGVPEQSTIQDHASPRREVGGNHSEGRGQILKALLATEVLQHALQSTVGEDGGAGNVPLRDMALNLHKGLLALG